MPDRLVLPSRSGTFGFLLSRLRLRYDSGMQILTVTQVTGYISTLFDADPLLQGVWVEGEVSNFYQSGAGHTYFTLKDSQAQLRCVVWRTQMARVEHQPANGDAVLVHGRAAVYEAQGSYQLYVDEIKAAGAGALAQQLEALKARLEREGLFAPERKRSLPVFPRSIGVVTSPSGAAVRDILHVLKRRFPIAQVIVAPTRVQGDEAPPQIVAAIQALNACSDIDVIIVARGGGSLEELWAFNDERVARAVFASRIPVISGVGHETDWTICDWVADVRAPTPSAAAEIAVPDQDELRQQIEQYGVGLRQAMVQLLSRLRASAEHSRTLLKRFSPRATVDRLRMSLQMLEQRLTSQQKHRLELSSRLLSGSLARLRALSPLATLDRGYAVVLQRDTGHIIASVSQAAPGSAIDIRVRDGHFGAEVQPPTSTRQAKGHRTPASRR